MSYLLNVSNKIQGWLGLAAGFILVGLTLLISADAICRTFLNKPIQGAYEVSTLSLSWIIYLCLAYALVKGLHVRVTFLVERFPHFHEGFTIIALAFGLLFFGVMCLATGDQFWASWLIKEEMFAAVVALPLWPAKMIIFLGSVVMFIQMAIELAASISRLVIKKR